jgi:hypothetical protein
MNEYGRHLGHLWPSREQQHLLQAALLDGQAALAAYRAWRDGIDLEGELGYPTLRLLPLVYHNLLRLGLDDPLMGRLKGVYRRSWCENQRLFFELQPVLRRLRQGGIDLLLLKGAPLVLSYYRNHALRPMADFDVAVRPQQLQHALDLLRNLDWDTGPEPSAETLRYFHAVWCNRAEQYELDVHYHCLRDCVNPSADQWFWSELEPVDFQGVEALQLAPTALLFHTILHGVRWNEETPVRWIADALTILRQRSGDVDWERLLAFADSQRLTGRLALGLTYLVNHFALELPERVWAHLRGYRPGVRERITNTVVLGEYSRWYAHPLTKHWVILADYCGIAEADNPLEFALGFSHYLRYRWGLRGRLEIFPTVLHGLWRRLGRAG